MTVAAPFKSSGEVLACRHPSRSDKVERGVLCSFVAEVKLGPVRKCPKAIESRVKRHLLHDQEDGQIFHY